MVDYTTYQPPGVQVTEELVPLLPPSTVVPTVVAIIGPGVGHKTDTEQLTLNGTTQQVLRQAGINPASVVVTDVAGNVQDPTRYTLTVGAGPDGTIANPQDNTLSINRNGTGITDGSVVFVTYNYQDADYFQPHLVEDPLSAVSLYGAAMDMDTGAILSPLTLAATLAFTNGASQVVLLATATNPVTQADLLAAYAKIANEADINVVVPLFIGVDANGVLPFANDLKTHVESTSRDGGLRIGIVGAPQGVVSDLDTTLSQPLASKRVVVVDPNRLNFYVGPINTTVTLDGFYFAAAVAGRLAGLRVQDPLTKKEIRGFSGLAVTKSNSLKNRLSQNGVAVGEVDRSSRLVIRHGRTTNGSNMLTREISMVRARDALVEMLQRGMDASDMVGSPISDDTPLIVKGQVAQILETAKASGVIVDYLNLQARQQVAPGGDPTIIEIRFTYKPTYPLNYINIAFSVDVSSGETDLTNAA